MVQTVNGASAEAAPERFNPSKHLSKLTRRQRQPDGQWKEISLPYLPVAARLLWLRTEHPEARLSTEIVRVDDHMCIVRAHVLLPTSGAEATGVGSETPEDWKDYVEKAETKAIGRALAALGFGTQFCDDFAEGEEQGQTAVVDAPSTRSTPGRSPAMTQAQAVKAASSVPLPLRPVSDAQRRYLFKLVDDKLGWHNGEAEARLRDLVGQRHGLEHVHELTTQQASELIDAIIAGNVTPGA